MVKSWAAQTDVLYLLGVSPTQEELEQKILSADLVYVGGGSCPEDAETLAEAGS